MTKATKPVLTQNGKF